MNAPIDHGVPDEARGSAADSGALPNNRSDYAAGAASASKMRFAPGSSPSDSAR
jgi:hypothetical protein